MGGSSSHDMERPADHAQPFAGAASGAAVATSAPDEKPARDTAAARDGAGEPPDSGGALSKERKAIILNVAAVTGVMAYGVVNWDYFQTGWKSTPEGWFERTTKSGGADKLGHFWFTYATSHLLAEIYRDWGYGESEANGLGALSALGVQSLMELGDGFSGDYGFSYEDFLVNVAGAGAAYLLGVSPELKSRLDLRMEYKPDRIDDITGDIFTDYEHQRYLAALKLDGFEAFRDSPLGYLELHAGYFTRGYENYRTDGPDPRRRSFYFGIGLNVTKLIQEVSGGRFALFNYLQLPYSSVRTDTGLD